LIKTTANGALKLSFHSFLCLGACLVYVICVCLRVVVSSTYCVVFLVCFSLSVLPVSRDCPFFYCPSVFSNVYSNQCWRNHEDNCYNWLFFLHSL